MKKRRYYETTNDFNDNFNHDFGDDFEVQYTEEMPGITLNLNEDDTEYDKEYDEGYNKPSTHRYRESSRPSDLAAPIENIVHTGSSLVETLTRLFFRPAPVLMSGIILLITAFTYWTDSAKYGNLLTAIEDPESSMVTFLAVGTVVVLWELCCFFFTVSGVWSQNGRGLTFFVLVYVLSYISGLAGEILPEGIAIIDGIRGGLMTYGSLYSMIFPFCVIGIITCILLKILGR